MSDAIARNFFGALAFVVAVLVIGAVLSPFVPNDKEAIANVILGNVLGWPMMVLAYHYGTNAGSVRKTELLGGGDTATGKADDPLHVVPDTLDLEGSQVP
jgi:hypothetical protein